MNRAVALDWTERAWAKPHRDDRAFQLARENTRLAEENSRLRAENADLAASAEIWIRLYEAALSRSTQASPGTNRAREQGRKLT